MTDTHLDDLHSGDGDALSRLHGKLAGDDISRATER
jgi:hypothetical protein